MQDYVSDVNIANSGQEELNHQVALNLQMADT